MRFTTASLTACLAGALVALAACTPEAGQAGEAETTAAETQSEDELAKRLVFMAGHVEAGIALYRAGEGEAGGPHLLHPVSEAYAEEREGLDAIGFDPAPFEAVSAALEAGRPASEIEPQLEAVEANLALMSEKTRGEPAELIAYLMQLTTEEYAAGVSDGAVSDAGEYQDAWGFAVVARQIARDLPADQSAGLVDALDALIVLWPDNAPLLTGNPASPEEVMNQAAKVNAILLKS